MICMSSGIYSLVNRDNGKRYVGSSKCIRGRINEHVNQLRHNKHGNQHLQNAWNLYGANSFHVDVLECCPIPKLTAREQYWIDHYQSFQEDRGYNLSPSAGSNLGFRLTEESKRKISIALRGKKRAPLSETRKEILRHLHTGRKMSEEAKAKISVASRRYMNTLEAKERIRKLHTGRKRSAETRLKISRANRGKHHILSDSGRQRILESNKRRIGSKRSFEVARKISIANRGKTRSAETKSKLSGSWNYEKHNTPEIRAKISASVRASWIARKQRKENAYV